MSKHDKNKEVSYESEASSIGDVFIEGIQPGQWNQFGFTLFEYQYPAEDTGVGKKLL